MILLNCLTTGCALVGDKREVTGPFDQLKVDVGYYNLAVQPIKPNNREEILVKVSLVPGKLIGPTAGDPIVEKRILDYETLEIPLKEYLDTFELKAATLEQSELTLGLRSEPREARFTRVESEIISTTTNQRIGNGLFVYKPFGEFIFPVYFDRECQVRGVVEIDNIRYVHNLSVTEPGLYWIIQREFGKNEFSFEILNVNRDIGFAIIPDNENNETSE